MTPKVQTWRVRFLENGQEVGQCTVQTINRRFARMLAFEACPKFWRFEIQTKVSRVRDVCPSALPGCAKGDYVKC